LTAAIFLHKTAWTLAHKTVNVCLKGMENLKRKFKFFLDLRWK